MIQTKLKSDDFNTPEVKLTHDLLVIGGIYMYREDNFIDMYDGMLAVCFDSDSFHLLYGKEQIEYQFEVKKAHTIRHRPMYTLGLTTYLGIKFVKKEKLTTRKGSSLNK